jgi:hypothetical protein
MLRQRTREIRFAKTPHDDLTDTLHEPLVGVALVRAGRLPAIAFVVAKHNSGESSADACSVAEHSQRASPTDRWKRSSPQTAERSLPAEPVDYGDRTDPVPGGVGD